MFSGANFIQDPLQKSFGRERGRRRERERERKREKKERERERERELGSQFQRGKLFVCLRQFFEANREKRKENKLTELKVLIKN